MNVAKLLPLSDKKEVSDAFRTLYQQKVGSLLFAAIVTRPDIAFAVSRLLRFNQQPGKIHHEAADQVFHYFLEMQDYCICYKEETKNISSFVYANDASFADNSLDRKSSQGYMMKLFGSVVIWRANKQDTVTTSSTEAELLVVLQMAKEAIYLSRLMKSLTFILPKALTIKCDNQQTIRLSCQKSHEFANQAASCQYTFSLAKTKSSTPNNLHSIGTNKKNDSRWPNKSLNVGKPQSLY